MRVIFLSPSGLEHPSWAQTGRIYIFQRIYSEPRQNMKEISNQYTPSQTLQSLFEAKKNPI